MDLKTGKPQAPGVAGCRPVVDCNGERVVNANDDEVF